MDLDSMINLPEENNHSQTNDDDLIDDMLSGDQSKEGKNEYKSERRDFTQEELKKKIEKLEEKLKYRSSSAYPEVDAYERLEELERKSSTAGLEGISGTISDLKLELDNIIQETEQGLEEESIQQLEQKELSQTELRRSQKELLDLEETYEERMENLWERIENLELELDENEPRGTNFSSDTGDVDFTGGLGGI